MEQPMPCTGASQAPESTDAETVRLGCGQVFPACSPRNSDAGDTDWASVEEKILRDVSGWLSPADLRRARLVCKSWLRGLATLSTKATTPPEPSTVTKWKNQLETMVIALPCLQEVTIGSKLSAVAAQQLGVLAGAAQLRAINIPYAQALQDRSLQALQPMAASLKELRIRGAASLSQRSLLLLSVLGNLEVLELKNCGKISWHGLQEAWKMACLAYEAQAAEAANPTAGISCIASSYSVASKLGGWLPGGARLFRTSSPSSNSIQSALVKQKSGGGSLLARMQARNGQPGHSKGAAAAAAVQLGQGAVGNGRSSSGGGSHEIGAVRKLLHRKQKQQQMGARAADTAAAALPANQPLSVGGSNGPAAQHCSSSSSSSSSSGSNSRSSSGDGGSRGQETNAKIPDDQQQQHVAAPSQLPRTPLSVGSAPAPHQATTTSALYKVGSLVWQGTTAAAAVLSSGSIARQSSAVQSALQAYIAEAEAGAGLCGIASDGNSSFTDMLSSITSSSSDTPGILDGGSTGNSRFSPSRRRASADKPLPAMPFTKLVSLTFTCSEVTLKNPGAELAAVAALTTLTHLEMGKCKLPDSVLWRLTSLTRLNKLKMSGLWSMGNAGLEEVAKLTTLKSLALSEAMHVTASGLLALSRLSGLTSLSLGLTQDLGPGAIARVAHTLNELRCLEVTASCWDDSDCGILAAAAAAPASAAAAAAAAFTQQVPHMLWNLPSVSSTASMSRSSSSKLSAMMVPMLPLSASSSRSNSSLNLRVPSFSSMKSFGSFSNYSLPSAVAAPASSNAQQAQSQQLLVLKLHGCSSMGHAGLAALKQLKQLQVLVFDNCKGILAADAISQDLLPPKLTFLSLKSLPFGNAFSNCVNVPACSGSLTRLELASLSTAHSGQLRRVLSFFPKLVELSLAGSADLGDAAMRHLLLLPKLQRLNLSGTRVTSQAFEQLMQLQGLSSLSLKGCNLVTDAGLMLLAAFAALQELDLSDCAAVSERGLMAVMTGVPHLVKLDVCGCKAATRELVQCCPHYLHLRHSL